MSGSIRTVVVTGAASGIGRATALLFHDRGDAVVAVDLDAERVRALSETAGDDRFRALVADVTQEDAVERMLRETSEPSGRIDVLVAAAGVGLTEPVDRMTEPEWNAVVDVSLKGTFLCCKHAIPYMRDGGAIVTFGSILGRGALAGNSAYGAAKAGVEHLTRALAIEHGPAGIRANCIVPGSTDTPMLWEGLEDEDARAQVRAVLESEIPLRRIADPVEQARVVYFLSSDEASFVNGTSLVVDGGALARSPTTY